MTKKEREEQIKVNLDMSHSFDNDLETRLLCMTNVIALCREYTKIYKAPYKHSFMNTKVGLSEPLLLALEESIQQAIEYHKNKENANN